MSNPHQQVQHMEGKQIHINQIHPSMKNYTLVGIVIDKGFCRRMFAGNDVHTIRIADHSGSVSVCIMTSEYLECIQESDILRFKNVYSNTFKGQMTVTCGRSSELSRVGEYLMQVQEIPNMSEHNAELAAANPVHKKPLNENAPHQNDPRMVSKDPRSRAPQQNPNLNGMRSGVQPPKPKDPRLLKTM